MTSYLFSLLIVTTHAVHLMSLWSKHHHHSKSHRSFRHASPHLWYQLPTSLRIPHPNYSSPLSDLQLNMPVQLASHCYHLPSLLHSFTLSLKPTFSENLILHRSLFLSVRLISYGFRPFTGLICSSVFVLVLFLSVLVIPTCDRLSWPVLWSTFGRTIK